MWRHSPSFMILMVSMVSKVSKVSEGRLSLEVSPVVAPMYQLGCII